MGVRVLLIASVLAACVIESGRACAQDTGSYTTQLPAVEASPPQTSARPGRPRAPTRVVPRVTRLLVYPTSPIAAPGTALSVDKVPSSINFVDSGQIQRTNSLNITDALQQNVAALNINEVTGNPFQPNVEFRGFVGSPVSGTPQGLAVYQNGVRVNEAFGDTVNWDLIPTTAIRSVAVVTNNPAFGLNALGGAVTIQMKDGFGYHGAEIDTMAGSFGRLQSAAQWGKQIDKFAVYGAIEGLHDDGFR
ncbi:MAG TPA: Plug domain-containing protein, partial [Bradyrhizobium sp.]